MSIGDITDGVTAFCCKNEDRDDDELRRLAALGDDDGVREALLVVSGVRGRLTHVSGPENVTVPEKHVNDSYKGTEKC